MTAPTAIRRLNAADPDFAQHLDHLLSWESVSDDSVNQRVLDIIKAVRERGDAALVEFTQRLTADARAHDTELLYERLEQLPQVLEHYGMRLVDYDPRQSARSAEMRRLFRFEASLDPRQTAPQTLAPAVVKGDAVVLRGLVIQPAGVAQAE